MKHSKFEFSESELQAYVDGKLNLARSKKIMRYLEQYPEEAERIATFKQQNSLLQTLYGQTDEKITQRVTASYKKNRKKTFSLLSYAASAAWLLLGVFIGWGFNNSPVPEQQFSFNLPQHAMVAHTVFTPEVMHPVEVKADQEAHLVKWLSKRLKRKLITPNLNPLGYSLVGGRLLPAQVGPAAQFMYENNTGDRLTLYVIAQSTKDTAFQFLENNNIKVFSWNDTNIGFAIVGSIDKQHLLKAATMIYDELVI